MLSQPFSFRNHGPSMHRMFLMLVSLLWLPQEGVVYTQSAKLDQIILKDLKQRKCCQNYD